MELQVEQSSKLKTACLVNLALLCQKEELFGEALKWCEKALQEQPTSVKAVYRQAQVQTESPPFVCPCKDLAPGSLCHCNVQYTTSPCAPREDD